MSTTDDKVTPLRPATSTASATPGAPSPFPSAEQFAAAAARKVPRDAGGKGCVVPGLPAGFRPYCLDAGMPPDRALELKGKLAQRGYVEWPGVHNVPGFHRGAYVWVKPIEDAERDLASASSRLSFSPGTYHSHSNSPVKAAAKG